MKIPENHLARPKKRPTPEPLTPSDTLAARPSAPLLLREGTRPCRKALSQGHWQCAAKRECRHAKVVESHHPISFEGADDLIVNTCPMDATLEPSTKGATSIIHASKQL